jgi:hypothetical protein
MLSALILKTLSYPAFALGRTAGTPAVSLSRSSRTRDSSPSKILAPTVDRDRTVSRRSEPSSRTLLTGEQPDPWDLLQPQDKMSRHRGAKPGRRCELSGPISLLSPEYLLSVERWRFHVQPSDHLVPLSRLLGLSPSQSGIHLPIHSPPGF